MGKRTVIAVVNAHMVALRQLKGDRKDYARLMLPQHIKNGMMFTAEGRELYSYEAEDQELYPAKLMTEQKVVTDAWLNKIFSPLTKLFGSASEQAAVPDDDEPIESDVIGRDPDGDDEDEPEDEPETNDLSQDELGKLEKAIKKGKAKKAKKIFDELEGDMNDKQRKTFKKQIKEL